MAMTQERYLELLNKHIKGDDEETLRELEELTDVNIESSFTQTDIDNAVNAKDEEWRKRYRERFFSKNDEFDEQFRNKKKSTNTDEPTDEPITIDDILKEKESE